MNAHQPDRVARLARRERVWLGDRLGARHTATARVLLEGRLLEEAAQVAALAAFPALGQLDQLADVRQPPFAIGQRAQR